MKVPTGAPKTGLLTKSLRVAPAIGCTQSTTAFTRGTGSHAETLEAGVPHKMTTIFGHGMFL
jgi:hypothetical protein